MKKKIIKKFYLSIEIRIALLFLLGFILIMPSFFVMTMIAFMMMGINPFYVLILFYMLGSIWFISGLILAYKWNKGDKK